MRIATNLSKVQLATLAALAVGMTTAGCAARTNPAVERAAASYERAAADPVVASRAPVALREARQSLDRARDVLEDNASSEAVEHYAYVTQQRVEIARAEARQKEAAERIEKLNEQRSDVVIDARTRQIESLEAQLENARRTDKGLVLTLGDVLFETGKAELAPGAMQNLYKLVTFLQQNAERSVVIEGHTDSVGSDELNRDLSRRRAEAVRGFLVTNGIGAERLIARGYGESFPLAPNTNVAGRQQNRRVEVVILDAGEEVTADAAATPLGMQGR